MRAQSGKMGEESWKDTVAFLKVSTPTPEWDDEANLTPKPQGPEQAPLNDPTAKTIVGPTEADATNQDEASPTMAPLRPS